MLLDQIIIEVGKKFKEKKPTKAKLAEYLTTLGVPEAVGVASLIVNVWAWLYPRDAERSPRCEFRRPISQKKCGGKIINHEVDNSKMLVIGTCQYGHQMKRRLIVSRHIS